MEQPMAYHVSSAPFAPGTLLGPGRFGELLARGSQLAPRELALEVVRHASFPGRPSRLWCMFAFPTLEAARGWIATEPDAEQYVVEVQPADGAEVFLGDQLWLEGVAEVPPPDWLSRAAGYWTGRPADASRPPAWELVIGGPVRVVRCQPVAIGPSGDPPAPPAG